MQIKPRDEQLVQQLQNLLGYLECEFLYLVKDIEFSTDGVMLEADLPSAKLALAAFCVERASRIVQEKGVVDLLRSRLQTIGS